MRQQQQGVGREGTFSPAPQHHSWVIALLEKKEKAADCHVYLQSDSSKSQGQWLLLFPSLTSPHTRMCTHTDCVGSLQKALPAWLHPVFNVGLALQGLDWPWGTSPHPYWKSSWMCSMAMIKAGIFRGTGCPHPCDLLHHGHRGRNIWRTANTSVARELASGHCGSQLFFCSSCLTVTKCRHDPPVSFGFENMRRTSALCFPVTMMLKNYILDST